MKKPNITHKDFNEMYDYVREWRMDKYKIDSSIYYDVDRVSIYGDSDTYSVIDEITKEDAQAISAVPEMLEALIKCYKLGDKVLHDEEIDIEDWTDAMVPVEKALKKAGVEL